MCMYFFGNCSMRKCMTDPFSSVSALVCRVLCQVRVYDAVISIFLFCFFFKCFHRRWRSAEQQQQQPEELACKDSCIRNDRYLCLQWINVVFVCDIYICMCECVDVEHESRAKISNLCAHSIVLFQPFNVHLLQWIFFYEWICWQKKRERKTHRIKNWKTPSEIERDRVGLIARKRFTVCIAFPLHCIALSCECIRIRACV